MPAETPYTPAPAGGTVCAECHRDAEDREARCIACPCAQRAEDNAAHEQIAVVAKRAAVVLAFGIEGTMPKDAAYAEALTLLYGAFFGDGDAARILAEGQRHVR
jgi:hypothetical protein